jgi:hypothetical protein
MILYSYWCMLHSMGGLSSAANEVVKTDLSKLKIASVLILLPPHCFVV